MIVVVEMPFGSVDNFAEPDRKRRARAPIECVVSIDFGTSRTGFAYAFKHNIGDHMSLNFNVQVLNEVAGEILCKEPGGQEAGKVPTALLLDRDRKMVAFGTKARELYYQNEGGTMMLFERFKMFLYRSDDDDEPYSAGAPIAKALNGSEVPLLDAISTVLGYIKTEVFREINKPQLKDIDPQSIKWVLTVPAIWKDFAKGFMRQAAHRAGIISDEASSLLELALEPEAACAACEAENASLAVGDTLMVLDCGGGTVDTTMHRVREKVPMMKLDELAPPSGGPWGSTYVDQEFERFLERLVGDAAFRRFKPSAQWVEVMKLWEDIKLSCDPSEWSTGGGSKSINVSELMEVIDQADLRQLVQSYNLSHKTTLSTRGKFTLVLPGSLLQGFFDPIISKITHHVSEALAENNVKYIFLVGGFAESKVLLNHIKKEFEAGTRRVVVPMRPGLSVLRGAVTLGLKSSCQIASRIARWNYGVDKMERLNPESPVHAGRPVIHHITNGERTPYVQGLYSPIVSAGQRITPDESFASESLSNLVDNSLAVKFTIFCSTNPHPVYTTDDGVKKLGHVDVQCRKGDTFIVRLRFGETEIKVSVEDQRSGQVHAAVIKYDVEQL